MKTHIKSVGEYHLFKLDGNEFTPYVTWFSSDMENFYYGDYVQTKKQGLDSLYKRATRQSLT